MGKRVYINADNVYLIIEKDGEVVVDLGRERIRGKRWHVEYIGKHEFVVLEDVSSPI